jgi:uncharacterized membrane protein
MIENVTRLAGIEIPSADPFFLTVVVGIHIPLGLGCVAVGALAMFSQKGRGRHSTLGQIYFWSLLALFLSATLLSVMRWVHTYHLFLLGMASFASACLGRAALRQRWPQWKRLHIAGMGLSYVLMLIARSRSLCARVCSAVASGMCKDVKDTAWRRHKTLGGTAHGFPLYGTAAGDVGTPRGA